MKDTISGGACAPVRGPPTHLSLCLINPRNTRARAHSPAMKNASHLPQEECEPRTARADPPNPSNGGLGGSGPERSKEINGRVPPIERARENVLLEVFRSKIQCLELIRRDPRKAKFGGVLAILPRLYKH